MRVRRPADHITMNITAATTGGRGGEANAGTVGRREARRGVAVHPRTMRPQAEAVESRVGHPGPREVRVPWEQILKT